MITIVTIPVQLLILFFIFIFFPTGNMINLTIGREDESLIHRSNLKRDMLNQFSSDDILRETIHIGTVGHDGKPEERIGSGVDRVVLGDFIYFFDWRSWHDLVQNIV